jgi:hypothetical protein
VNIVPKGYWDKTAIKIFWVTYKEEMHLAEIKPADYKLTL